MTMSMTDFTHNGHHSWLLEYTHKCEAGDIIVGRELMQSLDIFRSHFNNPDIKIDFKQAKNRIGFIEEKLRHFQAPFAGKKFKLELFQKAFIESIYIFKIYDEEELKRWVRLHQDILFLVAKKSGKTPLIAALCLAEWFCGPMGLNILCSSNDYDQAALMFNAIDAMREESPSLARVTRRNIGGIYFGNPRKPKYKGRHSYQNKGNIRKMSAKKAGSKEGRNIGVGASDEVHELKSDLPIMPIRQGLSTADEPLYFELTTEGFENDGYLDNRLKEARQVLNGELERPRWCIWLFTQDNEAEIWADERTWLKSNPGLGAIKKRSYLRQMVDEARINKKTRISVLAKDFNIKQNNVEAWLAAEHISNPETFDVEEFRNCFAIGGVDLARTGDLASARALFMKPDQPEKYMLQQYFIPESKLDDMPADDVGKYEGWIRDGLITVSPGNENDFSLVTAWYVRLFKDFGIRFYKVGYDNWSAAYWVKEMDDLGFDCVRIRQEWGSMSEPMSLLEKDLQGNLVIYNDNPIDKYCLENTAMHMNSKMEIMPVKIQGKEDKKIDGAVTMMFVYRVYIDNRTEFLELVKRGAA